MDKIPLALKPNCITEFHKLIELYSMGVLQKHEFMSLARDLRAQDSIASEIFH